MHRLGPGRARVMVAMVALVLTGAALVALLFPSSPGGRGCSPAASGPALARIHVVGPRLFAGSRPWRAWGFNWGAGDHSPVIAYFDHPSAANLNRLACELSTARRLGANTMRVFLELQQVMTSPNQASPRALLALRRLLWLAQSQRVYLDIAGNLVWRPSRVPDWYDRLPEPARWQVQANFWRAVARVSATSPAVLGYELTSEPAISDAPGYYAGDFGGWSFLQIIAHPHGRDPRALARAWTRQLAAAVRSQDHRPVTIGLLPGAPGFAASNVADLLDLVVIHEYPRTGRAGQSVAAVRQFASFHKPVLVGETFPLFADGSTQREFLVGAKPHLVGALEFFDGRDPNHMTATTISDRLYQYALHQFISLRGFLLNAH